MSYAERARQLRKYILKASESLSDEDALEAVELFEEWKPGVDYKKDDRKVRNGLLYKCVQPHTSQESWPPELTPALWTQVAKPGEIPVWVQPTGVQDSYMAGNKVHYPTKDDPIYISNVDYNIWAPDVYGWTLAE